LDFKKSEKFVYAHGNRINEKAFFLASVADSIFLTPTGDFEFDGFGFELTFFKNALDKLEIEPQIFQYGKFKGSTEPFKYEKLSDENKEQLSFYLASVYNDYLEKISAEIDISKSELNIFADSIQVNSAEDAQNLELVDKLLYRDQLDSIIIGKTNTSKVTTITAAKYLSSVNGEPSTSTERIAVIYALGEVTNSKGDEFTIGTENIIKAINKAKDNDRVKAIVMRVNSPGGSPLTSDMIWREIELASEIKPFIVSMGEVAASGGYYISCNADLIVAEPSTLTGSIGVYGIIPNTKEFFNNKLGITFDRVNSNKNSDMLSLTKPLAPMQKEFIQNQINEIYHDFITRVSNGRNLSYEDVDKIAEGRIWSGIDAKNIGLIDTLGSLDLALELAANKANVKDYKIVEYPTQREPIDKLMDILSAKIESKINFEYPFSQIETLRKVLDRTGIQVRLPFEYEIY
jgi:protease-4